MTQPILAFRTITEMAIHRLELVDGVLTPFPVPLLINPSEVNLNPNIGQEEIKSTSALGETVTSLMYNTEVSPELSLTFDVASVDLEGMVIGRGAESTTDYVGWVYFSLAATKPTFPAKTEGQWGFQVTAQDGDSKAECFVIDPLTRLATKLTVVESNPVGNQIAIGASMAITVSPELVATESVVYGWIPCTFDRATRITSKVLTLFSIYIGGITFDSKVRLLTIPRATLMFSGSLQKSPQREVNFKVLASQTDDTKMGYSIAYLDEVVAPF